MVSSIKKQKNSSNKKASVIGVWFTTLTDENPALCRVPVDSIWGFIIGTYNK